ncbi:RNA methyltransferase [Bartonella sp. HY329]|uniref:TrmH family RNA methyltransferase n=1 Tax=unclassified Bartonella TaxID=2645622 RepID=UPI0021C97F6E|nr:MULTISPECIES: RNA methyltransferase [unclassified Bartonella]UXM94817.1 RNA methyltransferase [Bartonella sp. HY329]UXN09140.1 RNA methyltransferase [Bartonella sp. HY328]
MMNNSRPRTGQVKEITSLANPIIKDLKALSLKKFRDREGIFIAEGLKLVIDALEQGWQIRTLVFAKSGLGNAAIEKVAARTVASGGLVIEANDKVITSITRRENPQTVIGVFEQKWQPLDQLKAGRDDLYIALDRVRDPGNLGTIIRTADAVGARGIVLIGDTTDAYSLETVRATMGSIFSVPLYRAKEAEFLNWRKSFNGDIIGTHLKGSVDYRTISYKKGPIMLMMGNEQQGLPDSLAQSCDKLARIPQAGRADSLNLAVATAVMLYEMRRNVLVLDERVA